MSVKPLTSAELVEKINPLLEVNDPEAVQVVYYYLCQGLLQHEMIPYLMRVLGLTHLPRLETGSEAIQKQWVTYSVYYILYSFIAGYQTAQQPNRKADMTEQQTSTEVVPYEVWVRDVYKTIVARDIRGIPDVAKFLAEPDTHEGHAQALLVHLGLHTFDEVAFNETPPNSRNLVEYAVWSMIQNYLNADRKADARRKEVERVVHMNPRTWSNPVPASPFPGIPPFLQRFNNHEHVYHPDWRDNRDTGNRPNQQYKVGDFPGYGPHIGTPRTDSNPNHGAQPIDLGQMLQTLQVLNQSMQTVVHGMDAINNRLDALEKFRQDLYTTYEQGHQGTTRVRTGTVEDLRPDNIPAAPAPANPQFQERARTGTVADLAPRDRDQPDGHNHTGHSNNLI